MSKSSCIIYYTSNLESPEFENKIIKGINEVKGDLPVISVSQKPLDFGTNICVGNVGYSYLNAFRQILLGCKLAKTDFVVMAESDCLYPKTGYFDFKPIDLNTIYTYTNVWILLNIKGRHRFYKKEQTHGSLIYGREYLIKLLEKSLDGLPIWTTEKIPFKFYTKKDKFTEFTSENPIVNVITCVNGRKGSKFVDIEPVKELPYWGNGRILKQRLFT